MMSKHPVGAQRASKVKFLKQFLPPPSAPPSSSSAPPVLADGCKSDRFEQYVPAARSHQPAGQLQLFTRVLPSLPGKEWGAFFYPGAALETCPRVCTPRLPSLARRGAQQRTEAPGWGEGSFVLTQVCTPHFYRPAEVREWVPCVLGVQSASRTWNPTGAAQKGKSALSPASSPNTCVHQLAQRGFWVRGDPSSFRDSTLP